MFFFLIIFINKFVFLHAILNMYSYANHVMLRVRTLALTDQEKVVLATREKDKGNEAFRVGEYEEAVAYYTR